MEYFTILNLDREPFSNSPDPDFFFQSRQHVGCLQKLELALRLKRGLNIVIGAVGAGKTTLCRTLLKKFASDRAIESHLILDPSFDSPLAFLESIGTMIIGQTTACHDAHGFKEQIKHHLYRKGVDEKKTVILVIDEGQKLPLACLEILRELLNYETNDHKLLQIVLFAQEEFQDILDRHANLADRVNLIHFLGPMSLADTRQMIGFRIKQASRQPRPPQLFTGPALRAIYHATGGYPRKIINLCHQCMLALIVQNRTRVDWHLVRSCRERSLAQRRPSHRIHPALAFSVLAALVAIGLVYLAIPDKIPSLSSGSSEYQATAVPEKADHPPLTAASLSAPETPVPSKPSHVPVSLVVPIQPPDERVGPTDRLRPSPAGGPPLSDMPELSDSVDETVRPGGRRPNPDVVTPVLPVLLGALTVKKNDTLGMMVKIIYGDFRDRTLKAVLDANPHIDYADAIRVGDIIAFPALPTAFVQRAYPLWWLKVGETESLDAAFRRSIKAPEDKDTPLMRIIAQWDHQTGLKYGIYVAGYFFHPSTAENMLAALPAEMSGSAEIISGWTDQTVLLSDPFVGKGF